MTKHRMGESKEYRAWLRIKTACFNKNNGAYKTYGGRGVTMDNRWVKSFRNFYEDMGNCPDDCTGLELINMNGDFERLNCRWVGPTSRRNLKDMPNQKNRTRTKKYKQPKRVVLTLEKDYFEFIQRQAIEKSRENRRPISVAEMLKEVVFEQIPAPRQLDMFKKKKT